MSRPALLAATFLVLGAVAHAAPAPPYYSVQVSSALSIDSARADLARVADWPDARIEERGKYFAVRIGAWPSRDEAREALPALRDRGFHDAAVLHITHATAWLEATPPAAGSAPAEPASSAEPEAGPPAETPTAPAVSSAPPPLPKSGRIPPEEYDFRAAAHALDWQVRNLVNTKGLARRDGFIYALDVAWLMRHAVRRSDQVFYEELRAAAEPLVLDDEQEPFTRGFVLWRHRDGVPPEVTGSAEAMHLARALWEGAGEFGLERDRALALTIIDGYARHAFEVGDDWMVRKYYAFGSKVFASLSVVTSYLPDFLREVEARRRPDEPGPTLAERSYGIIERAVHEDTGLLYPIVQPEINQTYPGLDLEVYAPNNVLPVADGCDAAEGVVRRRPDIAEELLDFIDDEDRRNRQGYPYAYFRPNGKRVRRQVVGTPTIACLARLSVAVDEDDVLEWLRPVMLLEMQSLAAVPAVQEVPLFGAGPLLIAADDLGAFRE